MKSSGPPWALRLAEVEAAGITKTALILVGGFLGSDHELSKLYDKTFTHGYRKGISEK